MSDTQFHETRMGRTFYEVTMPKLVEQLERLNKNLERAAARLSPSGTETRSDPASVGIGERAENKA